MAATPNASGNLRAAAQDQLEQKQAAWAAKRWTWVIDDKEGCVAGEIIKEAGNDITVRLTSGQERTVSKDDIEPMNPPKFDKCEDMTLLTHLNESSVLSNLRDRYYANLIYTYSGLFLVVINPWRRLPIYTDEIVAMYKGKKRGEVPPHVFAVCDEAYRDMLEHKENQSLLITGESGAGKTENTKKVIQYLASVAGTAGGATQGKLEQQILQTNPLLEAFGNAKTIRNNNSSRFGKFIRIEFGSDGKIVGCTIDNYLLEKSRVVRHGPKERNFHIFYQLIEGAPAALKQELLLTELRHYKYLEGETTIDGVDNAKEFGETLNAMNTIGFTTEELQQIWAIISGVLQFGNMEFIENKRDDSATIKNNEVADKLSHVLGIKSADVQKSLLKPRVKAGRDWVTATVTAQKAEYSCQALAKTIYERLFKWIVSRINSALETHGRTAATFIGCLDIAGFEIFDLNSFEQLCINLTNEKLQQFFNHHMFTLEQEEYAREGIDWKFVDFGLDLQPTIDLIEKPMGILSILDEECLFPKATDATFVEKLHTQHGGKSAKYGKLKLHPQMFCITHYAGQVDYDTTNWLDKNKDPINDNVASLFSKSTNSLLARLFEDAVMEEEGKETGIVKARTGRSNTFITVAQRHRQQLTSLIDTLYKTHPHFVRCIIPNEVKKPGIIEAPLVLEQLRCNGVLEGIRIVRMGFPSRVAFAEFRQRYEILATGVIPKGFMDSKVAVEKLITALQVRKEDYRMGNSKIFFKAGILAAFEEKRDEKIASLLSGFQAAAQGYLARKRYRRAHGKEEAIRAIQKNAIVFIDLYKWSWWKLFRSVKPLLGIRRQEQEEQKYKDRITELETALKKEEEARQALEGIKSSLEKERDQMSADLSTEREALEETIQSLKNLEEKRTQLTAVVKELESQVEETDKENASLETKAKALANEVKELKNKLADDSERLKAIEETKKQNQVELDELRKKYDVERAKLQEDLDAERKKREAITTENLRQITELQSQLDRLRNQAKAATNEKDTLAAELAEAERKKLEAEKAKRKLEADLNDLTNDLRDKNNRRQQLEDNKKTMETQLSQIQVRLDEAETGKATLAQLKANLDEEVRDLREQLTDANKAKVESERVNLALESELEETATKFADEEKKRKEADAQVKTLQRELETTVEQVTKAREQSDNALMEALKAERIRVAGLEEKLRFETQRRISAEERLHNEIESGRANEAKLREVRELLRK